jgi:hypothetical protein
MSMKSSKPYHQQGRDKVQMSGATKRKTKDQWVDRSDQTSSLTRPDGERIGKKGRDLAKRLLQEIEQQLFKGRSAKIN